MNVMGWQDEYKCVMLTTWADRLGNKTMKSIHLADLDVFPLHSLILVAAAQPKIKKKMEKSDFYANGFVHLDNVVGRESDQSDCSNILHCRVT